MIKKKKRKSNSLGGVRENDKKPFWKKPIISESLWCMGKVLLIERTGIWIEESTKIVYHK